MKSIVMILLLAFSFAIAPAFAEEAVETVVVKTDTYAVEPAFATAEQMNCAVSRVSSDLSASMKKTSESLKKEVRNSVNQAEDTSRMVLANEDAHYRDLKKENGQIRGAITTLADKLNGEFDGVCSHISFWAIVITLLIIAAVIALLIAARRNSASQAQVITDNGNRFIDRFDRVDRSIAPVLEAASKARDEATEANTNAAKARENAAEASANAAEACELVTTKSDQILAAIGDLGRQINDVPEKVKIAVNTLDDRPIVVDADSHTVTYHSPKDGIAKGYYLDLYVPKGEDIDPATYDRAPNDKRGVVERNTRRIMGRYFRGELNAPEYKGQKALIEYLHHNKELLWTTI